MASTPQDMVRKPFTFLFFSVATALMFACVWTSFPRSVPVWWNLDDSPCYWGPEWLVVPAAPILGFFIPYMICFCVSRDRRLEKSEEESQQAAGQILSILSAFLFGVNTSVLLPAFASSDHRLPSRTLGTYVALMFLIGCPRLERLEPNLSIGILTPWTLRSGRVWRKTHTQAGYVLPLFGLALLLSAFCCWLFVPQASLLAPTLGLGLTPFLYLDVYSWFISRDPESEPLIS